MESSLIVSENKKPKTEILIVDDNQLYLDVAKELLKETYGRTPRTASTPYHAREILHKLTGPAIALVDFHMPKVKGLALIEELYSAAQFPLECVLVTAETPESNPQVFELARKAGIHCFSKMLFDKDSLHPLGESYLGMVEFAEARLQITIKQVVKQITDSITGFYTWEGGEFMWPQTWARGKRDGFALALAFLDFNDFKTINDTYGHAAGDKLLRAAGRVVRSHIRTDDHARRRGDEILIPMEIKDTHNSDRDAERTRVIHVVEGVMARIITTLQKTHVEVAPGAIITPSVSVGISAILREEMTHDPHHDFTELLMKPAEVQMYENKGRHYQLSASKGNEAAKKKYRYYRRVAATKAATLAK